MPPPDPVTMATLPVKSNRTIGAGPAGSLAHDAPSRLRWAMTRSATALISVDSGQPM